MAEKNENVLKQNSEHIVLVKNKVHVGEDVLHCIPATCLLIIYFTHVD